MKLKNILVDALFISVLFLAAYFRFFNLNQLPPSLFSDEVDAGYQALTFNRCQSDYFGHSLPIHFQSYSDWRTSLYIYSIAFSQRLTYNPDLAVRLPAAVFGLLSCVVFYFIIKTATKNRFYALLGFLTISLSPWLIHYSRAGFEVTGMIFCLLLSIFYWLKFNIYKQLKYLYTSLAFLAFTPYFYSTAKFLIPFILFGFIYFWRSTLPRMRLKSFIAAVIFLTVLMLPLAKDTLGGQSGFRFSYISIFSQPNLDKETNRLRYIDSLKDHQGEIGVTTSFESKLAHSRPQLVVQKFITNYLLSFSTDFLFVTGDANLRQGFTTHGYFFATEFFLIIIGLVVVFLTKRPLDYFFIFLLIIGPIPFALTRDSLSPHATRLIVLLPSFLYLIVNGQIFLIEKLKSIRFLLVLAIIVTILIQFTQFWHTYTYHYPQISARYWHTGMKEAVLEAVNTKRSHLYFSDKYEPFLPFYLYYTNYIPKNLSCSPAQTIIKDKQDFISGVVTDNQAHFGIIEWSKLIKNKQMLTQSIFIIPQSELLTVQDALGSQLNLNKVYTTPLKFQEQESFIIFALQ